MEQGGGQGQGQGEGQYQHYHSHSSHSPSPSQESSSSNVPPPPPTFGTPVSSGYSDATGGSSQPLLQHAHSEPSGVLPPTFHSHAHHGHAHGPHQPNAGGFPAVNGDVGFGTPGPPELRSAQSMPVIPMGPPPSFAAPSQYAGPPGPPVFSSPPRPQQPDFNAQTPRGPSNFAEIPLASHSAPLVDNGFSGSLGSGHQHGVSEEEFDAYSLSASAPFLLFSAQKVLSEKKLMNTASLGFGALVCPGRETEPRPPIVMHEPFRCQNCGAYVNQHSSIAPTTGLWSCTFCNKSNDSAGEYRAASLEDLRNWPELATSVVDYVDSGTRRPGFVSVSESSMTAPVVLVIDDSLDEEHLTQLQESLHTFLDSLSPATRIGIVTYGRTVAVFDLSESGVAAADVLPGDSSLNQDLKQMLIYGTGVYLAPVHACLPIAHSIISALRPYRGGLAEAKRERCLGTAVEVVLALIQGPATELPVGTSKRSGGRSRVLLSVGGPTTLGPGSLPYSTTHPNYAYMEKKAMKHMEHLGQEARRLDIAVDILCAGTCPVRIPTLQPLVNASGGLLVLHDDFGEVFCTNLRRAVRRPTGFRGILEIRCSDDVAVTRVIGPGEEARGDASTEHFRNDTSASVHLLSVEDCQAFAIAMELEDDLEDSHVYFQIAARYTSMHQAEVTRVVTVRLPTTDSVSNYLQSVDDEVAAVLIAKKTVLEAKTARDAADMRASVDERVKDIAMKLGSIDAKSKMRRFPSSLSRLPELLFHLKRGPLLGSIIGHEDERAVYRNLYLQAGFELSLRMMAPRLLMHREAGTFEELPAYDVGMQSESVIVLDHGTDVFIWTGLRVAADESKNAEAQAACRTLAQELTEQRFPAPRMLSFKIFQKKMLAEARQEQAKLGIFPTAAPRTSSKGWQVMPGAPALVRYLEERGLKQALLARGSEEDLTCLLDQLGNYKFQHITHVSNGSDELALGEPLSNERLKRICMNWALPPKEVMVVIGGGAQGEAALAATGDSGFFVCHFNNTSRENENQDRSFADTAESITKTATSKRGIVSWFTQLKEGTLHVEENHDSKMRHLFPKGHVHFSVTDMVELKWVIEDLNGVSYRKSTLISGFQDLGQGAKQL